MTDAKPVLVRPARLEDAEAIERLRVATWRAAYRGMVPQAFLDAMPVDVDARRARLAPADGVVTLVATAGDDVVGWAVGGPTRDEDRDPARWGEVYACYVAADRWGGGIGGRLLRRVVAGLVDGGRPDVGLWVLAANERARRFYAAHGFTPDGARKTLDLGDSVVEIRCVRRA